MFRSNGMTNRVRDLAIRNKIIAIYIPLVILPLMILGFVSNRIYTDTIVNKTVQSVSDNSRLIVMRIQGMMQNAESCANSLVLSLNRLVKEEGGPGKEEEPDPHYESLLTNQLTFALLVFPDVDSAAFVDVEGRVYASRPKLLANPEAFWGSKLQNSLKNAAGESHWLGMQRRDYLVGAPDQTVLTLGKKVTDIGTGKLLGWLILNLDERDLSGIFPGSGRYSTVDNFLVDWNGDIVSSTDSELLMQPVSDPKLAKWIRDFGVSPDEAPYRNQGMLAVGNRIPELDWTLVSEIPLKELTRDTVKVSLFIVVLGVVCLLLALSGAGLLSKTIVTPLVRLTRTMRQVQDGEMDKKFEVRGHDEIGLLGEGFNRMISRIRELLRGIRTEQRLKREYELALLHAQVKPHFLYNTLDVIYTLSEMGRTRDVQRTTKALADYYRIALSKGKEMITLGEELQNVRDYLSIQRIRYSDVFDYRIEVPPELHSCAVLKLTLQPLVENAIYHGLKPAGRFGMLRISGEKFGKVIELRVRDDGVGMDAEKSASLWNSIDSETYTQSFGLRSVHERTQLFFGESYGVALISEPGLGTTITVTLPFEWKLKDSEDEDEGVDVR